MKTLDEHNASRNRGQKVDANGWPDPHRPEKNGIECPECQDELWDTTPTSTCLTYPPKWEIHCDCGYSGYRS